MTLIKSILLADEGTTSISAAVFIRVEAFPSSTIAKVKLHSILTTNFVGSSEEGGEEANADAGGSGEEESGENNPNNTEDAAAPGADDEPEDGDTSSSAPPVDEQNFVLSGANDKNLRKIKDNLNGIEKSLESMEDVIRGITNQGDATGEISSQLAGIQDDAKHLKNVLEALGKSTGTRMGAMIAHTEPAGHEPYVAVEEEEKGDGGGELLDAEPAGIPGSFGALFLSYLVLARPLLTCDIDGGSGNGCCGRKEFL